MCLRLFKNSNLSVIVSVLVSIVILYIKQLVTSCDPGDFIIILKEIGTEIHLHLL